MQTAIQRPRPSFVTSPSLPAAESGWQVNTARADGAAFVGVGVRDGMKRSFPN